MIVTEQIRISYRLKFISAFHFGTGLRRGLIDRTIARDKNGYLYVPGSTLKGTLRDRCEQLATLFNLPVPSMHSEDWAEARPDVDIVSRIFGSRFHPGHLYFDDAYLSSEQQKWFKPPHRARRYKSKEAEFRAWQSEQRTQVAISRLTGTAQPQRLYTSEYGIRPLRFDGSICGFIRGIALENPPGTYALILLVAGLKSLDRLGGNKSTGAGMVECEITSLSVDGRQMQVDTFLEQVGDIEYYGIEG